MNQLSIGAEHLTGKEKARQTNGQHKDRPTDNIQTDQRTNIQTDLRTNIQTDLRTNIQTDLRTRIQADRKTMTN